MNLNLLFLVLAAITFGIGAINKLASSDFNWTNAGLCFITLSLIF